MDTIPGAVWNYNGGGVQLLAELSNQSVVMTLTYLRKNFFLSIKYLNYKWIKVPKVQFYFTQ